MEIDKKWFYQNIKHQNNKYQPIFIDMTLSKENLKYRLIFDWTSILPNGKFSSIAVAQLLDNTKCGIKRYVTNDLIIDMIKDNITTDYKLYKKLNLWVKDNIKE